MRLTKYASAILISLLLLPGCLVGPDYSPPPENLPKSWSANQDAAAASTDLKKWWSLFSDPVLDELIAESIQTNNDLKAALARVKVSRAEKRLAESDLYPFASIDSEYNRERQSQNSGRNFGGDNEKERDYYQAGFDATWEIDVFGGVRRGIESASAQLQAEEARSAGVKITVIAEVARNYFELRTFQRLEKITRDNIETQKNTVSLTEFKFQSGVGTELDAARARAQLSITESELPEIQTAARKRIHALSVLLGREPSYLLEKLAIPQDLPKQPPSLPLTLPSELLRQRPDIIQAERTLASTNADIGVAVALYYPKFNLLGTLGVSSQDIDTLTKGGSTYWSVGPNMSWPILAAGRIRANVRAKEAGYEEAFANYDRTVLEALKDVEDALVSYENQKLREQTLTRSVEANQLAYKLAQEQYQYGAIDFLNLLQVQGSLFLSQAALVRSNGEVVASLVALYKALGGGWQESASDMRN